MNKCLKEVLEGVNPTLITGDPLTPVRGITCDSRRVKEGYIFAPQRGERWDGTRFIHEALERGAVAIILPHSLGPFEYEGVTVVEVEDSLGALLKVSSSLYGEPSKSLSVAGITGTNGKSTTAHLFHSILTQAGLKPGLIGTIEYIKAGKTLPAPFTTPPPCLLQGMMREMKEEGAEACVMEVSSHSLSQRRVDGIHFDACLFTNLSRDHLDYHGEMEAYFEAKRRLFVELLLKSEKGRRYAVVNRDDPFGRRLLALHLKGVRVLSYGVGGEGDVHPLSLSLSSSGTTLDLSFEKGEVIHIRSPLIGIFNAYNILAAISLSLAMDLPPDAVRRGIEALSTVKGRLERVENPLGIDIFIDYAHTPDALKSLLGTLGEIKRGRLITIFGCGGDRDRGKRPEMGFIATQNSDFTVITSDNPRTEDPLSIIEEIKGGVKAGTVVLDPLEASGLPPGSCTMIPDRREAIRFAIERAGEGDMVVLAGKGHEMGIISGREVLPFSDREELERALRERLLREEGLG